MQVQAGMDCIMNYFKFLIFNSYQMILFLKYVILITLNLLYQQHFLIIKKFVHQPTSQHPSHAQIIFMILHRQFYRNPHSPHLQNHQNFFQVLSRCRK